MPKPPKPVKPTPDFPLYAHTNGQWAKRIKGKIHYFGPWDDPDAALARFLGKKMPGLPSQKPRQENLLDISPAVKNPRQKPDKPYPDFPLFPHSNGQWAKKIRGKIHFFGPWRDAHGALRCYLADKEDLEAGREPQRKIAETTGSLTVQQMVGLFLDAKQINVQSGEMEQSTWDKYELLGNRLIEVFGANTIVEELQPADFSRLRKELQKTYKRLSSVNSVIGKIKAFFNWAGPGTNGEGYLDRLPRFGGSFKRPSRSALERERQEDGGRVFAAEQIRAMLADARLGLKAMILLGINCGYGNTDCAKLTLKKLDFDDGWINFPRTKNAIRRRNPLWPETIEAIRSSLEHRKPPKEKKDDPLVFVTKYRKAFCASAVGFEFEKLAVKVGMTREEADFYDLRRTCTSIGLQVKDDEAMRTILGHKRLSTDMLGVYDRLPVSDERLRAVTDYIHAWLFPVAATSAAESNDGQHEQAVPSEPTA